MITLSALIVARNEEAQLRDCLDRLTFADQIVVVLDRTTDGSKAIAESFGATILEGGWELEGPRRNAGLDACTSDWILEVDADERIPAALAEEIRAAINDAGVREDGWFLIPFDNYIGGRRVRHGWGGSFGVLARKTLFPRGAKRWGDQRVHPSITLKGSELARLTHRIDHYVDDSASDVIRRLDRYTDARAADLRDRGEADKWLLPDIRRVFSRFFKCYVSRGGWKEGGWGLLIAICAALFPLLSRLKARLEPEGPGSAHKGSPPKYD